MAATFNKSKLSGSSDGKMIKIPVTSSPGHILHVAVVGTGDNNYDEVWLWACNVDTVTRLLTVEWGGSLIPDDQIEVPIPAKEGLILVIPGWSIQNGRDVKAFASVADKIMIGGYVNGVRP